MAGPTLGTVRIDGLRELNAALRRADADLPKEMRRELKKVADRVAEGIKAGAPKGPSGNFAGRIVGRSTMKTAAISWPRTVVPYAGFIEFGNKVGAGGGVGRGDSHPRPFHARGRFIFPYVDAHRPEIERDLEAAVDAVLRKADLL